MAIFLEDYYSQELKGELILQQSQQLLCYNFSIEKNYFLIWYQIFLGYNCFFG